MATNTAVSLPGTMIDGSCLRLSLFWLRAIKTTNWISYSEYLCSGDDMPAHELDRSIGGQLAQLMANLNLTTVFSWLLENLFGAILLTQHYIVWCYLLVPVFSLIIKLVALVLWFVAKIDTWVIQYTFFVTVWCLKNNDFLRIIALLGVKPQYFYPYTFLFYSMFSPVTYLFIVSTESSNIHSKNEFLFI